MTCIGVRGVLALLAIGSLLIAPIASGATIEWTTVGAPGNAADTTGYGAVGYVYQIGKFEVTNNQYADFLNAVATTDTHGLYNPEMVPGSFDVGGGITRQGTSGGYSYTVDSRRGNHAVSHVSWFDSLRFANWIENGQPVGEQTSATTEDGAYTFVTPTRLEGRNRNPDASIFLASEDEWYKAAYYDALSAVYYEFPTSSNTAPICERPFFASPANAANCSHLSSAIREVGGFERSPSPNGTFDQGGNVWEWLDTPPNSIATRGVRGGSFRTPASLLNSSIRAADRYNTELDSLGFRLVRLQPVPEPSTALLVSLGLAGIATAGRRRS